jgi:hypothetical protein
MNRLQRASINKAVSMCCKLQGSSGSAIGGARTTTTVHQTETAPSPVVPGDRTINVIDTQISRCHNPSISQLGNVLWISVLVYAQR